jgi:hypothetical protein
MRTKKCFWRKEIFFLTLPTRPKNLMGTFGGGKFFGEERKKLFDPLYATQKLFPPCSIVHLKSHNKIFQ